MRASVVMVEPGSPDDLLADDRVRTLLAAFPVVTATGYRTPEAEQVVLLETPDAPAAVAVADAVDALAAGWAVRALQAVHRMARDAAGEAVQVPLSAALRTRPAHLMSVVLPVPAGRLDEWSRWYDDHHMPTVLTLERAITVGHRFAPLRRADPDEHLVFYEFPAAADLERFGNGAVPATKTAEYLERWGVRNRRRMLGPPTDVPGGGTR
ncbi:hypothetical protein GCM10009836_38730 [Pseudonocardia ailaonensis]|uniref:EthD domain-containing protein n=1 Tax=Pseudonocardia ailaonensis TaxID=367279 RepID=A0ABN2N6T1_9PSEU